jgi:hypothetical protein
MNSTSRSSPNENPFAPYSKPYLAFYAVARFGIDLVEHPLDFLVLIFIAERTASWAKAADAVSLNQFVAGIRRRDGVAIRSGCGLQLTALKQALARLEKRGLLICERRSKRGAHAPTEYRIDWKRFSESIKSQVIPLAARRPRGWSRDDHTVREVTVRTLTVRKTNTPSFRLNCSKPAFAHLTMRVSMAIPLSRKLHGPPTRIGSTSGGRSTGGRLRGRLR